MKSSFFAALLFITPFIHAQTSAEEARRGTEVPRYRGTHNDEIIVTASALPEEADETPVAATVITRQQLESREVRDVSDALREVPGLTVSRTGSPGKATTLFVRGGSSKQALVLWNGVQLNNPYFSGYDVGQLSTAGVEKVEVVRGPFSALYGSEAVSGVVNVLTNPSRDAASIDLEAGENGLFNGVLFGALANDRWNAHAALERRQDDGFFANDDFESAALNAGAAFTPNAQSSIGVLARYTTYELGIPFAPNSSFTAFAPSPNRGQDGGEWQLAIPMRYDSRRFGFELRLSDSRHDETFRDPDGPFGPELNVVDSGVRTARATARTATPLGTITVGGEYTRAVVDLQSTTLGAIDSRDRTNRSFFVEDRLSRNAFELTLGVRHDDFGDFGSETSPRIAAAYVRNGHKLRAAYGEGFRAPAIGELYFPFGGNVNLGSERSRNAEVGYERFAANGHFSVTVFDSHYENLIAFGPTFQFENIQEATARGVELGAARTFGAWQIDASYTWLDTEDEATGSRLVRRPEHSGSLAFGYHHGPYSAQLVVVHKGALVDVTDLFPFGTLTNDAHTTADAVVHYAAGALRPYLKVENVTDERYEETFGYPSAPRRFVLGVRYALR
jgi:vitamin B12 transporter